MITTCPSLGTSNCSRRNRGYRRTGGTTITFNVETQWRLTPLQAELRFFYRGMNTVAEYYDNGAMTPIDDDALYPFGLLQPQDECPVGDW